MKAPLQQIGSKEERSQAGGGERGVKRRSPSALALTAASTESRHLAPSAPNLAHRLQTTVGNRVTQRALGRTGPLGTASDPSAIDASDRGFVATLRSPAREVPYRQRMEQAFSEDFSGVAAHLGESSALHRLGAVGAASGEHVAFADTRPNSDVVAHELTHVVQTRRSRGLASASVSRRGDASEREAHALAPRAAAGQPVRVRAPGHARVSLQEAIAPPTLSGLRTIAQGYIGDYFSAARAGLTDFEQDLQSAFDWSSFWVIVGGNVIWAAAAFATGGTAFLISLGGITVSSVAAAGTVTTRNQFHAGAVQRINDVVTAANNEVDRVTRSVHADAVANGWDDNRTRNETLRRLLKPEYITTTTGGLPNLDQPKVAAKIREKLLIKAAHGSGTTGPFGNIHYGPGYFEEVYEVANAIRFIRYPMSPAMPVLQPVADWYYRRTSARIRSVSPEIIDINASLNDVYSVHGTRIDPSIWDIEKRLVLTGSPPFGVTYYFDADNNLVRWEGSSFSRFLSAQGHDPDRYLRGLLQMIQHHSGHAIPLVRRLTT